MPPYNSLPSKDQWKKDAGLGGVFGNAKSPFPAIQRIGEILERLQNLPAVAGALNVMSPAYHLTFLQYIYVLDDLTYFVMNNRVNPRKLGGPLSDAAFQATATLYRYVHSTLLTGLAATEANLTQRIAEVFGKEVNPHSRAEDQKVMQALAYYTTKASRAAFKLAFREGSAHRWAVQAAGANLRKLELQLYDTVRCNDEIEWGGSLYVMDKDGHIFVTGKTFDGELKHSSILAGDRTLCAGTIRIEEGRVRWVSGKSGHYQPTVIQMVNLLERLRGYGVDLSSVIVYRENPNAATYNVFEGCAALDLLKARIWPTGIQPHTMKIL